MTETKTTLICNHPEYGQLIKESWAFHFHRPGKFGVSDTEKYKHVTPEEIPKADLLALDVFDIQKKKMIYKYMPDITSVF